MSSSSDVIADRRFAWAKSYAEDGDHAAAADSFGVPDHYEVTTAVAVGRAAPVTSVEDEEPSLAIRERRLRDRNPLRDFVFGSRFGSVWESAEGTG
ncbi:MAG: hypothetical protein INR72_20315 [Williamsia herbipolensis]|nr:hypothetical protein [Williamsia herbipolensis]